MHDHAADDMLQYDRKGLSPRSLRLHLDNSHDARTSGWDFDALDQLHHKLHAEPPAAVEGLVYCAEDHGGNGPVEHHPDYHKQRDYNTSSLYVDLLGAREKLCRAQAFLPPTHAGGGILARGNLDRAIRLIDTVGAEWCPDEWSRFDQPAEPPTVVDLMEALEESLAKARRTLGVTKSEGPIPSDAPGEASGPAAVDALPAPPSSEGVEPCLPRLADRPIPSGVTSSGGAS